MNYIIINYIFITLNDYFEENNYYFKFNKRKVL